MFQIVQRTPASKHGLNDNEIRSTEQRSMMAGHCLGCSVFDCVSIPFLLRPGGGDF